MKTKIEKPFVLLQLIFTILSLGIYFLAFSLLGGWNKEGLAFHYTMVIASIIALTIPLVFSFLLIKASFILYAAFFVIGGIALATSLKLSPICPPFFFFSVFALFITFTFYRDLTEKRNISERFVVIFLICEFVLIVVAGSSPLFLL